MSEYGEVERDEVREVLPEQFDDRQLDEAVRWLRERGEVDAYFEGGGGISMIRWMGDL